MAGFGMIVAGAAKGLGTGIVEKARAQREMMMKMLDEQTQDRRLGEERAFRSGEAEKARKFEAEQNQLTRDSKVEYGTSATGDTMAIRGTKAEPVLGADGKPVKLSTGKTDADPAEVKTAEWLVKNGVAKDPAEAWSLVRRARENPEGSRASIFKAWMDALTKGAIGNVDGAKIQEEATRLTEQTMRSLEGGDAPSSETDPQAPPAPRDPGKRTVGQVYTAPDGRKIKWMGEGWQVVE